VLQLGGQVQEGATRLAEGSTAIPARNIPDFLLEFLQAFQTSAKHPDFAAFLDAGGRQVAEELAQRHALVSELEENS
jgi:hypothetical protein